MTLPPSNQTSNIETGIDGLPLNYSDTSLVNIQIGAICEAVIEQITDFVSNKIES
jgi:hypothetical protein